MGFPQRLVVFSLILLASSTCPARSWSVVIEKVLAVVNSEIITKSEVQEQSIPFIRRMHLESSDRSGSQRPDDTERQILEGLIERRLQLQEARRQGILVSSAEIDAYIEDLKKTANIPNEEEFRKALIKEGLTPEKLKKDVEDHLILLKIVGKEVRSKIIISEQEVRKAYEEEIDKFVEPLQVRLRFLLIPLPTRADQEATRQAKSKAEAALLRLKQGEDFSRIAREYSSGPMAEIGGDIGYVKKGELHPDVDRAVFSLGIGQHSDIISIPSGLVIIKVEERRSPIRPFTEVADQLRKKIYEKKVQQKYQEWVQDLRARAFIEVK